MKTAEFNEAFMGSGEPLKGSRIPGFGAGNRTPETSRVHKRRAAGGRSTVTMKGNAKRPSKGLARAAVVVIREDARKYTVVVKGTRELVGVIRKIQGAKGAAYSFQRKNDVKPHKGFATQKAAVARMLEGC